MILGVLGFVTGLTWGTEYFPPLLVLTAIYFAVEWFRIEYRYGRGVRGV